MTTDDFKGVAKLHSRLKGAGLSAPDFADQIPLVTGAGILARHLTDDQRAALVQMDPKPKPRANDAQGNLDFGFCLDGPLFEEGS
jgi:hypothetical protein